MTTEQLMRNRAAIKYLMGLGVNPELSAKDQAFLRPHAKQQSAQEARAVLERIGWDTGERK